MIYISAHSYLLGLHRLAFSRYVQCVCVCMIMVEQNDAERPSQTDIHKGLIHDLDF